MNKVKLSVLWGIIASLVLVNSVFAMTDNQNVTDQANSIQATTQQSPEEIQAANEKSEQAKILVNSINDYKSNKISKNYLGDVINNYNQKYNTKINIDKITGVEDNANTRALSSTPTGSSYLGFSCVRQQENWYCGPASAYILINGMGNKSGRTLSQNNLASDLGATTSGASFPGTWNNTLFTWTGKAYVSVWGPSASDLLGYAYADTLSSMGTIYDTYMSGSNQLPGYASGSTRYHYVAGDGYDYSNSRVHYLDPHNTNNTAYGTHWTSASNMADCISSRGMVW